MADTGLRSFAASSGDWYGQGGANAIDDNDATLSQVFDYSGNPQTVYVSELEGDDIPAGVTITGVEIEIKSAYGPPNPTGGITFTVQVSSDGPSGTFDTSETSETMVRPKHTETFGSSTESWGVDFSGWTDITNLAVKMIFTPGTTALFIADMHEIRAKIYYTVVEPPHKVKILSGQTKILGGKLIIK